jgi:hypothetical protein
MYFSHRIIFRVLDGERVVVYRVYHVYHGARRALLEGELG